MDGTTRTRDAAPSNGTALRPLFIHRTLRRRNAKVVRQLRAGGKVVQVPSPNGWVEIIGLFPDGSLCAKWGCLEEDWRDSLIDRMARHVRNSKKFPVPMLRRI